MEDNCNEEIRLDKVSKSLKKDLKTVAEKRGCPTLSAFLKPALRKLANEHLADLKLKSSSET